SDLKAKKPRVVKTGSGSVTSRSGLGIEDESKREKEGGLLSQSQLDWDLLRD
ncbi:13396_t:CDS:1, partial [Acaulospora colombiana]